MRRKIVIAALALVMLAGLSQASALHAQERRSAESAKEDHQQVLRTLLDEVRQLRMALQRSNALNHKVQITVERLRLQQGRVDSLTRSLENVRSRITDLKSSRPQMEEQIKYVEAVLARLTEQNRREQVELEVKEMKARVASWSREEEQLRQREAALTSELQSEQNKLSE